MKDTIFVDGFCADCEKYRTCTTKVDVRTLEDDINNGIIIPIYIPSPVAPMECQQNYANAERGKSER